MPSSLCALSKPSVSLLLAVSIVSLGFGQWIEQLPREFKDSILWSADHEEGDLSDWTMSLGKDPGGGVLNTGDPDVIAQATNTQRHSGKYSAQATIQEAVRAQNGLRAVRFMRWSNKPYDLGGTEFPGEAYYSTWMFLDETYNPNKYAPWDPGDGGWWIVFQFKAHDEQGESQPTWMLNIRHDDTTKRMFLYLYSPVSSPASIQQDLVAVPVGRWFHVEAFCKVSVKNEGRVTIWQDGVDYLIRALAKVRKMEENFFAIVVGRGPALESLKKLTEELGLKEHVLFTGYVEFEKVPRYIASFDICATPDPSNSYNDSCTTIKTMEYMAIGRPTVAFRTKENEITAGEAGFYAENNSEDEFAELIVKLAKDPELRSRMGKIGRERIEQALDWSHQRKVLIRLYDDLFAGRFNSQVQQLVNEQAATTVAVEPKPQFYFNGRLQEVLSRSLAEDISNARLSTAFYLYYQIRPLMPIGLRKLCQRSRNRSLPSDRQWYIPHALANHLETHSEPIESPWSENADFALLLTHDVETQQGFSLIPKLAEIEESLGFRSSWNLVPYKYKIDKSLVDSLKRTGHEVAIHGYNHDGRLFQSKRIFDSRVPMINQAIERYEAVGFRAPMVHRNLAWMQQLNIEYDASCFDIDPYQAMPGGVQGIWPFAVGKFVELPYTMPQDHTLFVSLGETTDRIWREKLQFIQRHHGMALMLTHPDYLDSPSRLAIYRDFLVWLRDHSKYWHVLPREMATWFRKSKQNLLNTSL